MVVDKHGNHVRKSMRQPCGWGRVDICMTFHMRAFDFFLYSLYSERLVDIKITKFYVEKVVPSARKI
jgi:hypothetical protein